MSVSSLEDEQFFSAPSSRIASRHVSVHYWKRIHGDQPEMSPGPDEPSMTSALTSENHSSFPKSKLRLQIPEHQENDHRSPKKAIIGYADQTRPRFATGVPKFEPDMDSETSTEIEHSSRPVRLMSSPAPPVTTKRWSSISIGAAKSPQPRKSKSTDLVDTHFDDPIVVRRGVESIVSNIQAYLSHKRHEDCTPSSTAGSPPSQSPARSASPDSVRRESSEREHQNSDESPESYLVTTRDIAGILDVSTQNMSTFQFYPMIF